MRKIHLANEKRRDAEVGLETTGAKKTARYVLPSGAKFGGVRLLESTAATELADLQRATPDPVTLGQRLIEEDAEIDMELVGRKLEDLHKVYLTESGGIAYDVTLKEHVHAPDGTEKEVKDVVETQSNVALENFPIRWTGKLFPRKDAIRKFVFVRSCQLRHVNGLTYDFLFEMAKKLADAKALMLVGGGEKGTGPIIMNSGGTQYRGFLEGRVDGDKYMLILHLTNLELKELPNG